MSSLKTGKEEMEASANGDEAEAEGGRRSSARNLETRHAAPPPGLFSTVFFQHSDATKSLRCERECPELQRASLRCDLTRAHCRPAVSVGARYGACTGTQTSS